jgi:hypothetical protein
VELLIVVTVLPLVVGALSYGLLTVLQLQSGVANRLADTSDAQMVNADFSADVQSAINVTTNGTSTSQCYTGTQVLGMEWGQAVNSQGASYYQSVVSYVIQPVVSGSTTTYALVRQYCTSTGTVISSSTTPVSTVTLSNDLPSASLGGPICSTPTTNKWSTLVVPTASSTFTCANFQSGWISATNVLSVTLAVTEPNTQYSYQLVGVPQSSSGIPATGSSVVSSNNTTCGFATTGTGTYANNLCFVDFSPLQNLAQLNAAESYTVNANGTITNCGLEMSSTLPGGYVLYFCLGIANSANVTSVTPVPLPSYPSAALGNSITNGNYTNVPFYTGIPGDPALYQQGTIGMAYPKTTTIVFSGISVVNAQNVAATGWEFVSADAESTDSGENITWTSNSTLSSLPNGLPWDNSGNNYIGNACGNGLTTSNSSQTIQCVGLGSSAFNGAEMVYGSGNYLQATLYANSGLEAISFGLLTAGSG